MCVHIYVYTSHILCACVYTRPSVKKEKQDRQGEMSILGGKKASHRIGYKIRFLLEKQEMLTCSYMHTH